MKNREGRKLLGVKLVEAGVISEEQLKVALQDQKYYNLKLGKILANHNWVKQRTADFFAQEWEIIQNICPRQPLGYYLKRAALLNDEQIDYILNEQEKNIRQKFGEIAVQEKWLKDQTIAFFLESLNEHVCSIDCENKKSEITLRKAILYINEPYIALVTPETIIRKRLTHTTLISMC